MPELPEIANLARQMDAELAGRVVAAVEVRQPKCLNMPVADFERLLMGKQVGPVRARGKWVLADMLPDARFMLSLGMGGDALFHVPGAALPEKCQVAFRFADGSALSMGFWWFGYAHAVAVADAASHKMTAELGLSPLDDAAFTPEAFLALLEGRRGGIKSFLLDQKNIAGIGNVYIQDILFRARLHPERRIPDISADERRALFAAIRDELRAATDLGGLKYEKDLYGNTGRFETFRVGYRQGSPCPVCGATIVKIKTGSTASFICPECQR